MEFRDFSDDSLILETKRAAQAERDLTLKVLHLLREVERRRLFSKLKYKSLHEFAVKELRYSDGQANRRIVAMRLTREVPELENKLSTGAINLTNLVVANTHFNNERKSLGRRLTQGEKGSVLRKIETLSTRAAEKVVLELSSRPATLFSDQVRSLTAEFSEVKFAADQELLDKLETIKGLFAHKIPNATTRELLHELCDIAINAFSLGRPKVRTRQTDRSTRRLTGAVKLARTPSVQNAAHFENVAKKEVAASGLFTRHAGNKTLSRAQMIRQVWLRDRFSCTNCGSKHALQQDHRIPRAKGGADTLENSRLLCRNCNQRAAIEEFGLKKMSAFLKSPQTRYG